MPSLWSCRVNRSAEARAERARQRQKKAESWERMKTQVAAKYARRAALTVHAIGDER